MANIQDGRYQNETERLILTRMVSNAESYFGESLADDQLSPIVSLYRPVAHEISELQKDVGLVLDSAQIDHAEGKALDLLCSIINVSRNEAEPATGQVTFSRSSSASKDYAIPKGTVVRTDTSVEPEEFKTTEKTSIASGTTSTTANVEALDAGIGGNVAADRITVFNSRPAGVENVTNNSPTDGGTPEEKDEELRKRAKEQLSGGGRASARAIITAIQNVDEDVRSVNLIINDTSNDNTGSGGLPNHAFEPIVECPSEVDQNVANVIAETKATGDNCVGGIKGTKVTKTTDLPNGQTLDIEFSKPNTVKLYIDIEVDVIADDFPGKDAVRDSIVDYVGGTYANGEPSNGELKSGDDVIYGEVEYAIREVPGVYDVTSLTVGTSDNPTGTSNLSIPISDSAQVEANDSSVELITTEV